MKEIIFPLVMTLSLASCDSVKNVVGLSPSDSSPTVEKTLTESELRLKDVNDYRVSKGLKPLEWSKRLTAAARFQATYMADNDYVGHDQGYFLNPFDGKYASVKERVEAYDYKWTVVAENVAGGQDSWEQAFAEWKASPGHNANLLNPKVTEIGIASVDKLNTKYKHFWAMVLGSEQ